MDPTPKSKTLYDTSSAEIFGKNFLAGFAKGLGGFIISLLTWFALFFLLTRYVLPQIQGPMNEAKSLIQSVEKIQRESSNLMVPPSSNGNRGATGGQTITVPPGLLEQMQQMQKTQQ